MPKTSSRDRLVLPQDVLANIFVLGNFSIENLLEASCVSRQWYKSASEAMSKSIRFLSVAGIAEAQDLLPLIRRLDSLERLELSAASQVGWKNN
jgi:hypothetical protein